MQPIAAALHTALCNALARQLHFRNIIRVESLPATYRAYGHHHYSSHQPPDILGALRIITNDVAHSFAEVLATQKPILRYAVCPVTVTDLPNGYSDVLFRIVVD